MLEDANKRVRREESKGKGGPARGLTPAFSYSAEVSLWILSLSSPYWRLMASMVGFNFWTEIADSTCKLAMLNCACKGPALPTFARESYLSPRSKAGLVFSIIILLSR